MPMKSGDPRFKGFRQPQSNWSKLPHQLIEQLPAFDALSEMKVTLYILRHTWGYREYGKKKRLTIDDFVNGRKRSNGTRIDNGTGLSEQGVRDGLKRAIDHGFVVCQIDDSDKARIKKYYALNLSTVHSLGSEVQSLDLQSLDLRPQTLDLYTQKSVPRTKKETTERNKKKEKEIGPNGTETPFVTMKNAIHAAFGYDKEKTTDLTWSLIGKAASELLTAGAKPDDIKGLYAYCSSLYDNFKARALVSNWEEYQKICNPVPTPPPATAYVYEEPEDLITPEQQQQLDDLIQGLVDKTNARLRKW